MTGRIYFILASTFFMGMFTGAYLYVTVFAPEYKSDIASSEIVAADAIIIKGEMYGGCSRSGSCASFRLIDDRSYNYLSYPEDESVRGEIPSSLSESLFNYIGTKTFFNDAQKSTPASCSSYVDGIDYSYEVELSGKTYMLDTCGTAFSTDETYKNLLMEIWKFMDEPTATYPTILEKGPAGFLQERFQNSGQ